MLAKKMMKKMKRIKEKLKAIWYIIKGGQYAVYVINDGYEIGIKGQKKTCCVISDNASDLFLDAIIEFTNKYKNNKGDA